MFSFNKCVVFLNVGTFCRDSFNICTIDNGVAVDNNYILTKIFDVPENYYFFPL